MSWEPSPRSSSHRSGRKGGSLPPSRTTAGANGAGVAGDLYARLVRGPSPASGRHVRSPRRSGASLLGLGYLLPGIYFAWSLVRGQAAGPNPFKAKGLEWEKASSPPIPHNFETQPVVTEEAYNYAGETSDEAGPA